MGRIAVLPPAVRGQIAAGEVIERPASVVKELVENALDAGARRIDVELVGGGLERIVVRDDGEGMGPEDAVAAFGRHATSKLARAHELASVATHGFRGEALPSIAAVARVRLTTRRATDAGGAVVEADVERARPAGMAGAAPGTSVEVRDLFGAVPARRKFMRAPQTEIGHASALLEHLAVARPSVGFRLVHEGREVLALPAVADAGQRVAQVLGHSRAARLVPFAAERDGYRVEGFLGPPAETVTSARLVWTYVALGDGAPRWVRDRLLLRAVLDGYASVVMRGRYPIALVVLAVPRGDVDVNVHPAKLEVRFRDGQRVHRLIAPAVRARLAAGLAPAGEAASTIHEPEPTWDAAPGGPRSEEPPRHADTETLGLWAPAPAGFRALRFVGQLFAGYLLCEGDGRVVLIDQHAAHERVVFERLRAEWQVGSIARDPLLVPETVALPPAHVGVLAEHGRALGAVGLEGEPFGDGTYLLRTVPRTLVGRDVGALLRTLAAELAEEGASAALERAVEAVLATVACHSVVRVGQRLDAAQVRALLDSMDGVEIAAHCPHGRPVAAELGRARIEALFGR